MKALLHRLVSQGSGATLAAVVTLSMTAHDHRATTLARNIGHSGHATRDVATLSTDQAASPAARSTVDFDPFGTGVIHRYP